MNNRSDVSWLDDWINNKLTDNIVSAGNISCLSDKFPSRNFPSASLPGPNYPRREFSKREFFRSEMLQIGTIRVGTVQVEVTRARDILVGVAGWKLSQHCLTLLRFSFGKFNMFKIKSKLFRTNKKMQQRFCSPHTFHGPGSCVLIGIYAVLDLASSIEGSGFWDILESWILQSACSGMEQATTYYLFPISIFLISFI